MQDPKIQHMNVHDLKLQDYFVVSVTDQFFMVKPSQAYYSHKRI